jgi:predicted dinucleotide-binding enzyme
MRIGMIGSGRIGGTVGRLLARAGHEVLFSYSRDPGKLAEMAAQVGATAGTPSEAVGFSDVVVLTVPWGRIDDALAAAGPLEGRIVVDTTNPYDASGLIELPGGTTAAAHNAARMPGARYVKAYNTLTAAFLAEAAERQGPDRVALFHAGDDPEAQFTAAALIADSGFVPVGVGLAQVAIMEAPRRDGAVYGEEYRPDDALQIATAAATDPDLAARLAVERKVT